MKVNRILLIVVLISQIVISILLFQVWHRQPVALSQEDRLLQVVAFQEAQKMLSLADAIVEKLLVPEMEGMIECSE